MPHVWSSGWCVHVHRWGHSLTAIITVSRLRVLLLRYSTPNPPATTPEVTVPGCLTLGVSTPPPGLAPLGKLFPLQGISEWFICITPEPIYGQHPFEVLLNIMDSLADECMWAKTQGVRPALSPTPQPSQKPQCPTENAWASDGLNALKVSWQPQFSWPVRFL